jgi:hypothetical protein
MAMLTSGRCPPRHLLGPSVVRPSSHGWMPMPGRTMEMTMPGRTTEMTMPGRTTEVTMPGRTIEVPMTRRTMEKGAHRDYQQSSITAAMTAATITVTDTIDSLARGIRPTAMTAGPSSVTGR